MRITDLLSQLLLGWRLVTRCDVNVLSRAFGPGRFALVNRGRSIRWSCVVFCVVHVDHFVVEVVRRITRLFSQTICLSVRRSMNRKQKTDCL